MKYLQTLGQSDPMTTTRVSSGQDSSRRSTSSEGSSSLVEVPVSQPISSPASDFVHVSHPSHLSEPDSISSTSPLSSLSSSMYRQKARLLYCKSHVAIHPTQFNKDNISGYLAIVEADVGGTGGVTTDAEGNVVQRLGIRKEILITWVPDELLDRMSEDDKESYRRVEGRTGVSKLDESEEDGFVFVTLPPPKGEKYAFSVPLANVYSILVYPPSLQHWYGSATVNLTGGVSLPTLFFHDDESPLLSGSATASIPRPASTPRSQWGFPPFLQLIQGKASLLRSKLITGRGNHNAELWLINPSKADRDVHESDIEAESGPSRSGTSRTGDDTRQSNVASSFGPRAYPPARGAFPDSPNMAMDLNTPKQTLLTGLSNITSFSRKMSQQILSHPLAKEVVPHLPPAFRSLVTVPGEWERSGRSAASSSKRTGDVASEFESARLYLAKWARVVAEEGERARRTEVANKAALKLSTSSTNETDQDSAVEDLSGSLGVFSMLNSPNPKRAVPKPTRSPQNPITSRDWQSFAAQGRDEYYVRREIFRRGFSDSTEPEEMQTRREGWEVLLGILSWNEGGVGGGVAGKERRQKRRDEVRREKREEYQQLKSSWRDQAGLQEREEWKEEWHRIDVDCRRTDRTHGIFAIPSEAIQKGDAEKESGGAGIDFDGTRDAEEGGSARLNPHIAALRIILMTYHTYSPELGYVQGMSDLLSPIYAVFDANEADSFWGLVGVMKMMEGNFLRDQSGMKKQLSTLQQLIGVMDPELHAHLDRTGSLNLFFCFRWILIAFKREFKFGDVIRLWEVLWTNYYSEHFVLFIALAVLQSHRDVLLRYLAEFDEVLKYFVDVSMTIDLDTTLAQAEVLFLSFRGMVEDLDRELEKGRQGAEGQELRRRKGQSGTGEGVSGAGATSTCDSDISPDLRELLDCFQLRPDEE